MRNAARILSLAAVLVIIYAVGSVQCNFRDTASATSNTFAAFTSTIWTQTSRADFNAGVKSNVDIDTTSGDVLLGRNGNKYYTSGNLRSQVLNTGRQGTTIDILLWDVTLPASTSITFDVRASNTAFTASSGSPAWTSVGSASPVSAGLPKGQYIQWRANLATTNNQRTPDLKEVQIWYH
jgi:hypothetical protein